MNENEILYGIEDGVATLTLNRPEARNAFGDGTREALLERLRRADADQNIGCVVITGAGEAFAAGGDIKGMASLQAADDAGVVRERMRVGGEIVKCIRSMSAPVVAAVNGAAAGAGMNLALACDLRCAAERAIFCESFIRIGLVPDWGGHYLLTRIVGTARAMELMMLGDRIDAATAERLGLVNAVFPDATFASDVDAVARRLAAGPRAAISAIKRGVYRGATGSLADTLAWEESTQPKLFLSADAREGMQAFIDKRRPAFTGR